MSSGVYCLRNILNDKRYIGSAVDLMHRKAQHLFMLRNNQHKNYHLQSAYNKYGEVNFEFSVLEEVLDKTKLIQREQYWYEFYKNNSYNMRVIVDSNYGRTLSQNTKDKISVAHKDKILSEEHKLNISSSLSGKAKSKEHIEKVSKANSKAILQIDKATDEIIREWVSPIEASIKLNIHVDSIRSVGRGKTKTAGGYKWRYK